MGLRTLAVLGKLEAKQPRHPCVEELFQVFIIVGEDEKSQCSMLVGDSGQ